MSVRLVEAELRLQSQILEQVHDAAVATNLDGTILSWNLAAERLYGYSESEALGLGIDILSHSEDRLSLDGHMRAALASGAHDFVGRFRHRSGAVVHAEVRLSVFRDERRNPIGIVSCSHDVTRRVEQEAELQLQSRLLESVGEAVFFTDRDGAIVFANPAASAIFLPGAERLAGKSVRDLLAGPRSGAAPPDWERIQLALRSQGDWHGDLDCVRANGERLACSVSVGEIVAPGAVGWVWVLRDITERKCAEAALRSREQLFHTIAEKAPVTVWTSDAAGSCEYVNTAWRNQWGLSVDEARQGKWRDFITADTLPLVEATFAKAVRDKQPFSMEYRMLNRHGEERVALSHGAPRWNGAGFNGFVGSTTDITEIRHAEAERRLDRRDESAQRLESLGVLAGGIAHDFNNLLVSILGFTEMAIEDLPSDHSARASIEQVEVAARRAAELTQQILTFSGRARPRTRAVNLGSILVEMVQLLERSFTGRARLEADFTTPTPDIDGDPSQIRQVAMNLLLNAADAADGPTGEVHVRLVPVQVEQAPAQAAVTPVPPRPGSYVCLEVSDNGRGMSEETQRKIFDPFFTTKPAGRGLGLASTLGIVRSHRGGIEVESAPGRGARFRVYFPVAAAVSQDLALGDASSNHEQRHNRALRLLLVDDDEAARKTLTNLLHRQGHSIHPATDRSEALAVLQQDPDGFDLILFDLMMPGMAAEEALWRFKDISPRTPVLLASGYSAESLRDSLDGRFGDGFLRKPFRREELLAAIAELTRDGKVGASASAA